MADEKSPDLTQKELPGNNHLNQLILDSLPCVALLLRPSTREIVASNQAARNIGAVPGTTCFATWGQRENPCPWCLAPSLWESGQPQHLEIEASGTVWDAHWLPVGPDLYMHYAFDITERKQMENALAEEAIRRRVLFEQSKDGIVILDQYGKVYEANQQFADMLGYSLEEVQQLHVWDWDALLTREQLLEMFPRVGADGERFETVHRRKDGTVYEVEITANWVTLGGQKLGFCVCRDILERKATEMALAKNYRDLQDATQRLEYSRNMLQLIIESVPVRVFWKDGELRYLGCNTLFARDAGFTHPQQLLGKDDFAMGWRDQADLYRTDDRQVMESRHPKINIVEPQTTPAGAKIWLNTSKVPLQMSTGEVFGVLGIYEDITSRKQAEEALLQSEEKFRLVFEKAPSGIMHYDQMSNITDCNEKFAEIIGASKDQFIGFNMIRQLGDDKMREAVAASLKGEVGYYEGDYLSITAGKITPVRAIFQPLFSSDGILSGGVTIFEDVSERKRAESERLQFSKLESLSTLAGGIAHDFNNILTAILGNIGLAMLDGKIEPQVRDRLAQAEQACLRAQALSQQLLTFAKGGAPIKKISFYC